MLIIRPEQMKIFEDDTLRRFKEEMIIHSKKFSPQLCGILGEEQLHQVIEQAMQRADEHGFTNRGPIRLYIEMVFLFGSDFDTDPQYPKLGEILHRDAEQMQRAEALYDIVNDYHERVVEPDANYVYHALQALPDFACGELLFTPDTFITEMIHKITEMYPQKAHYIGHEGLTTLIFEGRNTAKKYNFPTTSRGEVLLIILMFSFGRGCTSDLLYPWISQTLHDEMIVDSTTRAKHLKKKTLTWLRHVLAQPQKRSQA